MDLDGRVLGVFASGLRWSSALAVSRNALAVAEPGGYDAARNLLVTQWSKWGRVVRLIRE